MEIIKTIGSYAASISSIVAALCLVVRPFRERIFGLKQVREGQKALLRSTMVGIYYTHRADKKLTEIEFNNFDMCYTAYKALKGNSFIDKIHTDILTWEIVEKGD